MNETLWDQKALRPVIKNWLDNFSTPKEQIHALYLLSKFMYFGASNMRILLKSLYRDLYRYPIIELIRNNNNDTLDESIVKPIFEEKLRNTIFMGVGNPSESGAHLLYYFRQENKLSKRLFAYTDDIVVRNQDGVDVLKKINTEYYVFIDDFCGSGSQATNDTNVKRCVKRIRSLQPKAKIIYLMLFATSDGLKVVRDSLLYDHVETVVELDESFKCFEKNTRIFSDDPLLDQNFTRDFCYKHGFPLIKSIWEKEGCIEPKLTELTSKTALGFGNCQLLLGFYHNTPDNTLPIIWYDEEDISWFPMFKRYNKIYKI